MRGLTGDNYQAKMEESVSDTLKEQISEQLLNPLFVERGIPLPPGKLPWDLLEKMVENDPNNVTLLSEIYKSFETLGAQSPYWEQIINLI